MLRLLSNLPFSRLWWGGLIIFCLALEAVALYYQYVLNYLPCVLCIHVRMLLALLIVISILALLFRQIKPLVLILFGMTTGVWLWMLERSYFLLGTEQGWVMGECSMASGLPAWLALEQWFPALFHIHEPCGYTPFLVGRISMAEVLIVISAIIFAICVMAFLMLFRRPKS